MRCTIGVQWLQYQLYITLLQAGQTPLDIARKRHPNILQVFRENGVEIAATVLDDSDEDSGIEDCEPEDKPTTDECYEAGQGPQSSSTLIP